MSPTDTAAYYIAEAGGAFAALRRHEMAARLDFGAIDRDTLVWFEGLDAARADDAGCPARGPGHEPGADPLRDAEAFLRGDWQGQIREAVDGMAEPVGVDYRLTFVEDGRFAGSSGSLADSRIAGTGMARGPGRYVFEDWGINSRGEVGFVEAAAESRPETRSRWKPLPWSRRAPPEVRCPRPSGGSTTTARRSAR